MQERRRIDNAIGPKQVVERKRNRRDIRINQVGEKVSEKKVLIVDDSIVMRKKIADSLKSAGITVVGEAKDGKEAFEKYKELKPDLVTMDIVMPREHGIDALKRIIEFDPNAKIVVVSGLHQKNLLLEALQIGAKDYVIKPFSDQELVDAVKKTFK